MKILFVEPPKDFWFVMGEYLPPPLGILQLASYLEAHNKGVDISVLDCQAERVDWKGLEKRIESFHPDIVAPSALATCDTYTVLRVAEITKKVDPNITTVVGGRHFTATSEESLELYPGIDVIVRGEGEETLSELVQATKEKKPFSRVQGVSFRRDGKIIHMVDRPLIENLDSLPFPGYHFVKDYMKRYHFTMMTGSDTPYALVESSRGCSHRCIFCSQWRFWEGTWRTKSAKRIVDEIEYCSREFGSRFFWFTDDNFGLGERAEEFCDELINRNISEDIIWFTQARSDDIVVYDKILPKMRKAGNLWILMGLESNSQRILESFRKDIDPSKAKQAVRLLKKNDIFAQATFIIGERKDSRESIKSLQDFANDVDPDISIFMALTPYPGTELYENAKKNGWIEDTNWANYDMAHAIMPTEYLSRKEIQEELYECYRSYYGSMKRRITGLFSPNVLKRRTYRHLMSQGLLNALRDLF